MAFTSRNLLFLTAILFFEALQGKANFELSFMLDSYNTSEVLCTDQACSNRCPSSCSHDFFICDRQHGMVISYTSTVTRSQSCPNQGVTIESSVREISFHQVFSGEIWTEDGIQIFLEVLDEDDALVDRLAINITNFPVGSTLPSQTYLGIFERVQITATIVLRCLESYQGPRCDVLCQTPPCACEPGFTGEFCASRIDYCEGASCMNGATCVNGDGFFFCNCTMGFTGDLCEIDPCARVRCRANQRCVSGTCACQPGFVGTDCATPLDLCTGVNCNSGQCVVEGTDSYICRCDSGYIGFDCATPTSFVDPCMGVNCNSGQCVAKGTDSYTCLCEPGYTGSECYALNTTDCSTSYCHNNGKCVEDEETYSFLCMCDPGYTGEFCDHAVTTQESSLPNVLLVIVLPSLAAIVMAAVVVIIIIAVLCIRRKTQKRMNQAVSKTTQNNVEIAMTNIPSDSTPPHYTNIASANRDLLFSTYCEVEADKSVDEYDYPSASTGINRAVKYNIDACPAYACVQENERFKCEDNPAYVLKTTTTKVKESNDPIYL